MTVFPPTPTEGDQVVFSLKTYKWNGSRWISIGDEYDASDLVAGTVAVARGGTGSSTASAARTALGVPGTNHTHTLGNVTDSGTAAALDVGISDTNILQSAGVSSNEFLRMEALSTKVTSRTAAEVLVDIGAQATLTSPVTSPAITGVSTGSVTGVVKCSQAQYDAITPTATVLYIIV